MGEQAAIARLDCKFDWWFIRQSCGVAAHWRFYFNEFYFRTNEFKVVEENKFNYLIWLSSPVLIFSLVGKSFSGNIRNLAMEKVATTILFPCKYLSSGCSLMLSNLEKLEHEEICEWRPYSCPCPGASCKWQGGLEQVMPHLMVSHKSITTLQGTLRLCVKFKYHIVEFN